MSNTNINLSDLKVQTDPNSRVTPARLQQDSSYCQRILDSWRNQVTLPDVEDKPWRCKNPDVNWPPMSQERKLTEKQWRDTNFPVTPLPATVLPKINTAVWASKMNEIKGSPHGHAAAPLLQAVLHQLLEGADSGVTDPGSKVTHSRNFFKDPEDCKKMADALATEVKVGNMAGPLDPELFPHVKINAFMAIPKPNGDRRQVGNLSSPEEFSFNDGIPPEVLAIWSVTQTTAKQFSHKITAAGWSSIMSKSDMVSAYKTMQVCIKQRWLQGFRFCGKLFIDLCLIFGDKAACMMYDRMHFCILAFFVLPNTTIPLKMVGKTVDDITAVVPAIAGPSLDKFVRTYRNQLSSLNIQAALSDPECIKAFDNSKKGEILGVCFNTEQMTWNLSFKKIKKLSDLLWNVALAKEDISLHEMEKLTGKLAHFAQLAPPLTLLTASLEYFRADLIKGHLDKQAEEGVNRLTEDRTSTRLPAPDGVKNDCRVLAGIVVDTIEHPLPIVLEKVTDLAGMEIHTDASGCLKGSPSLGILVTKYKSNPPLVASLRFPYEFLHKEDIYGHAINCKSTLLESLGYLATLLLNPEGFANQSVSFKIDSMAAVAALSKGRSTSDRLATTIVKAARTVAASIGCKMSSEWLPRRSNRESIIADDLTHNLTRLLSKEELDSFLSNCHVSFPPPILSWMAYPVEDQGLGRRCVLWMVEQFPKVEFSL